MDKIVGLNYPGENSCVNIKEITDNFHSIAERVSVIPFETTVQFKDGWSENSFNVETGESKPSNYKVAGFCLKEVVLPKDRGVTYSYVLASPLVEDTGDNVMMLHQMGYCGVELTAHSSDIPTRMKNGEPIYLLFRARNSIPTVEMKFTIVFI
jgi:hypothetical protein